MRKSGLLAVLFTVAVTPLVAQDVDPPSRVARLNFLNGSVSFRPGSVEEWAAAMLNYPLTTADRLWTDPGAHAEMHIGSTAIRMAPQTAMSFLALDDRTVQLSVTQGSVNIRLRDLADDESYEIDTPNVAITLLRPGDYRIDADGERNTTIVSVRSGDAEVTGAGLAIAVHARQSARITGMDQLTQDLGAAPPPDQFDSWCEDRDRREDRVESTRYVPPEMTGYEDLDQYGVWSQEADYGWCWRPRYVSVGWAPYRFGHWVWVDPWGWTWIDDAPWGFAPFHYGRWAYHRSAWVWIPGPRTVHVRPVYAPALVVFVGGPHFGAGISAWFPLGPGEIYRPRYHASGVYVQNVNVRHVTNINITNITVVNNTRYVNQRVDGAVTAMNNRDFVNARHAARTSLSVNSREVADAQVLGTAPPLPPRRESVLGGAGAAPLPRAADRVVVVRHSPPPPPVSFAAKERVLESNQGRPLDASEIERLRGAAPARAQMVRPIPQRAPEAAPIQVRPQRVNGDFGGQPVPGPRAVTPDNGLRNDRPRRVDPVPVQPQSQPQVIEAPRQEPQRRVEMPRQPEAPRRIETAPRAEQPRPQPAPRVEQRPIEQPRVEQPRVEQPRPEPARRVEQPRSEPRTERPPAAEPRQEVQQHRHEQREEKREDKPKDEHAGRKGN